MHGGASHHWCMGCLPPLVHGVPPTTGAWGASHHWCMGVPPTTGAWGCLPPLVHGGASHRGKTSKLKPFRSNLKSENVLFSSRGNSERREGRLGGKRRSQEEEEKEEEEKEDCRWFVCNPRLSLFEDWPVAFAHLYSITFAPSPLYNSHVRALLLPPFEFYIPNTLP